MATYTLPNVSGLTPVTPYRTAFVYYDGTNYSNVVSTDWRTISASTGAGRSKRRRRKYEVEIDGEVFDASSVEDALEIIQKAKELAEERAKTAISRANKVQVRPVRRVLADARKTLPMPKITTDAPVDEVLQRVMAEIEQLYKDALTTIEIGVLLRRREEEDDEEAILALMA